MRAAAPMHRRALTIRAGVLALAVVTLFAGRPQAKVFEPETFTLDNGLRVVVITNRRAPIVTHMVYYRVGAADETPGESGLAHFLEHLMFKGTETLGPGEFSEIIAANGGTENAFTSSDYTGYYQSVARDRLEIVMKHEADRMTNLRLSDELVDPEREVVLEERRSRIGNEPGSQLWEMIGATMFLNHPYRRPVIGWEHEIRQLSTEGALAFYRRWYAPNNAILSMRRAASPWKASRSASRRSRSAIWRRATTRTPTGTPMPCRCSTTSWAAARPAGCTAPWSSNGVWPPAPAPTTTPAAWT